MHSNPVIDALMSRASVRSYKPQTPADDVIATIVRAGQQAPFAMQLCSVILQREGKFPYAAPLQFIICADVHRMQLILKRRDWKLATNDLTLLIFAIQDAAYMAQNMVVAAQALGLGSCYIGSAPMMAEQIIAECGLPPKVFPLVMLVMGYPQGDTPTRPRYPLDFTLFEGRYPQLTEDQVARAMRAMDEGYLAQDYYRKDNLKLPVEDGRADPFTFDTYSWTEHICRKLQWDPSSDGMRENLRRCGFEI
jgi:FMN reductase (NADPH)